MRFTRSLQRSLVTCWERSRSAQIGNASGVNRELRNKVLREWMAQGGIDMSWLYGEQPELPHVDNVPLPPPTRLNA